MRFNLNFIRKIILVLVLLELILGGGGRLIQIGSLTLRMYIFIIGMVISTFIVLKRQYIPKYIILFLILWASLTLFSVVVGYINGAGASMIFNDIKPLIFGFSLLFFYILIRKEEDINVITSIIKFTSVAMAIIYLLVLFLVYFTYIDFISFYKFLSQSSEFFFRGEAGFFTYKAFIYLGVGLIFWEDSYPQNFTRIFVIILISLAIIFSGTRGFILSLGIIFLLFYVIPSINKPKVGHIILLITSILLSILFFVNKDLGDKKLSDSIRITQISEVSKSMSLSSVIIGHGFGIGIPSRQEHMEIAPLEIFHKQGIIGVLAWIILFIYLYILYRKVLRKSSLAKPFFMASVYIFILSFTNPYINNPIGLTMILISIIVLNRMNH